MPAPTWRSTVLLFIVVWVAFAATSLGVLHAHGWITDFSAFTDFSARRVLDGQVPYRDFWTMYAPGSMYVLAGAFAVFGREHIVSQVLAMTTTALAVVCLYRLAARLVSVPAAVGVALLFAVAFYHSAYHSYFSTYPPAVLCLWIGAAQIASFVQCHSTRHLVLAGGCFGLLALFKHDMGAYACLSGAAALLLVPQAPGAPSRGFGARIGSVCGLAICVVLTMLPVTVALLLATGRHMVHDLVIYPLTDFRYARGESFPTLWPSYDFPTWQHAAKGLTGWFVQHVPLVVVAFSLPGLWHRRRQFNSRQAAILLYALGALVLFCFAASVQVNTHLVTLTALAALLAAASAFGPAGSWPARRGVRRVVWVVMAVWVFGLGAEPGYRMIERWTRPREFVGVDGLRGVRVFSDEAQWLRQCLICPLRPCTRCAYALR